MCTFYRHTHETERGRKDRGEGQRERGREIGSSAPSRPASPKRPRKCVRLLSQFTAPEEPGGGAAINCRHFKGRVLLQSSKVF